MSRFTRTDSFHRADAASRPTATSQRLFGEKVSVGEPVRIQGDTELRQEIETSLEMLAKQRLLEAEEEASALLAKARGDAAILLEKANAQAREMLAQTQAQVDDIRAAAHEEGFKAGFQEGYADATEQVERETVDLLRGANTLLEGAYQAEKLVLRQFEKQAATLMEHLLRKILRRELADSPETLMAMVAQAVESLYMSGKVQVVVSPLVIHELREYAASVRNALGGMERFEFIADPGLDPFQVFIVGQDGCFDLSPQTQMTQMMAAIEPHLQLPRRTDTMSDADTLAAMGQDNSPAFPMENPMGEDALLAMSVGAADEDLLAPDALQELQALEAASQGESREELRPDAGKPDSPDEQEARSQAMPFEFPSLETAVDAVDDPPLADGGDDDTGTIL